MKRRKMDKEKRKKLINSLIERDGLKCHYCAYDLIDARGLTVISYSLSNVWGMTALVDGQVREFYGPRDRYPTIDHVIPVSKGGTDDLENLVIACRKCNSKKNNHLDFQLQGGTHVIDG